MKNALYCVDIDATIARRDSARSHYIESAADLVAKCTPDECVGRRRTAHDAGILAQDLKVQLDALEPLPLAPLLVPSAHP